MQCASDLSATRGQLTDLILDYTRLCNSKCAYCGIWKEKLRPELALEAIDRLFQAKALSGLKTCYLTGGEPYITDKVVEIARLLHRRLPTAALAGATNGIQAGKILERVQAIRRLGCPLTVDISLNGAEATHDRTRGEAGFWGRAVGLMKKLRELGVPVNLAFSAMPETIQDLPFVAQLAKDHGCGLGLSWVRRSPRYNNGDAPLSAWTEQQAERLRQIEPLPDHFDCPAIKEILVVRPDGEVHPCETYHPALRLGNINDTALDEILDRPATAAILRRIQGRQCDWCQGPGFTDGSPKWMIMDCYRRRARARERATQGARAGAGPALVQSRPLHPEAPMVSVVIPCYNQARFLPEAVESVVQQTFADWEAIVVNDGSPDATSAVCRELAARWPERLVRGVEKRNGGLADARNAGIAVARGKYILPLDADDKLHPLMLAKTVALLEACPEVAIAYTDTVHFGAVNAQVFAGRFTLANLCQHNLLSYCALYRREVWRAAGGYNPNMTWGYEDWDFWLGCAERGYQARRIPEFLLYYRVKSQSMLTTALEHDRELRARLILNHPSVYPAGSVEQARAVLGSC